MKTKFPTIPLIWTAAGLVVLCTAYALYRNLPQGEPGVPVKQAGRHQAAGSGPAGDLVVRLPVGPISQQEFNDILDAGQDTRITLGAMLPDDNGTGTYGITLTVLDYPGDGDMFDHYLDMTEIEVQHYTHVVRYYFKGEYQTDFTALLNLMRVKNFFNLNVTRDPNGGPNRYDIGVSIYGFGLNGEDTKVTDILTNVRDTSNPDNAAFFEVLDFIHDHFVTYALANSYCQIEYLNNRRISETGPGCVPAN